MKNISFFYFLVFIFLLFSTPQTFSKNSIIFSPPKWSAGKKNEINGRVGPGLRYPIRYVYKTPFLPFKLLAYKDGWYKVQDFDNEQVWILGTLLTTKAAVFLIKKPCSFYRKKNDSKHYAILLKDVIVHVKKCSGNRCFGTIRSYKGWFEPYICGWGATPGINLHK